MYSSRQALKDRNQAENERKEKIRDLNKDAASLILGSDMNLSQLTIAFLIWATLSEIPSSILQFLTDGKSPEQRPLGISATNCIFLGLLMTQPPKEFYEKLRKVLEELLERVKQAQSKAANHHQQQVIHGV